MEFKKNGISILLKKDENEPYDMFVGRGWFIVSQRNSDLFNNFNEVVKLSKIWANTKFKKCKYNNYLNKKVKMLEKNMN